MKKVLMITVLIAGIFLTFNHNVVSWVKTNFGSNQKPYYQQRLEFFEKLSREYYGIADYGKELEVVNRSIKITDMSTDRTELIIPSLDAVTRLKERQSLAAFESYPGTKIERSASTFSSQGISAEQVSEKIEQSKSSMLLSVVGIILISAAISLFSYFKYRSKTKRNALLKLPDNETIITDDSILLDFDLSSFEEKRPKSSAICLNSVI
jgi:hypothetical protein